ncbi:MAG: glycosyltransferase family protein, partial [Gammaproteobacteria bacterium]
FLVKPFGLAAFRGAVARLGEAACDETRPGYRVVLYSHDGFGLGHLRRNANIAHQIVTEWPGASVLMLIGSPCGELFQYPPGVDYIKLPSIVKVGTGKWQARGLRIGSEQMKRLRGIVINNTVEQFEPDLMVVDHTPTGVWGELLPTLKSLRMACGSAKCVLGLRDILDAPEVTCAQWRSEHVYESIAQYYDKVLIYGERETFDAAAHYGLDATRSASVAYCGYLTQPTLANLPETAQAADRGACPRILIMAGGGYDAYPMMRACVDAWRHLEPICGAGGLPDGTLVLGPLMPVEQGEDLRARAAGLPLRILTRVDNAANHIAGADLVVTMGGYNALVEALAHVKRTIVIPREGPSAEQRMRARLFAELGLVRALDPDASPLAVARAIAEALADPVPESEARLATRGAANAVRHLRELLTSRQGSARAVA